MKNFKMKPKTAIITLISLYRISFNPIQHDAFWGCSMKEEGLKVSPYLRFVMHIPQ